MDQLYLDYSNTTITPSELDVFILVTRTMEIKRNFSVYKLFEKLVDTKGNQLIIQLRDDFHYLFKTYSKLFPLQKSELTMIFKKIEKGLAFEKLQEVELPLRELINIISSSPFSSILELYDLDSEECM